MDLTIKSQHQTLALSGLNAFRRRDFLHKSKSSPNQTSCKDQMFLDQNLLLKSKSSSIVQRQL